jgi:hypothetical protein
MQKHRFLFESLEIVNNNPVSLSFQNKDGKIPPTIQQSGKEVYMITASSLRGGLRRRVFLNHYFRVAKAQPGFQVSSEDYRLFCLGGVRGSGAAPQPNPLVVQEVRQRFPLLSIFGFNTPFFMAGHLAMGIMTSEQPVTKYETLPIIRRSMLTDRSVPPQSINDWGRADADQQANRYRSQAERVLKDMERQAKRRGGDVSKLLTAASEQFGQQFADVEAFKAFVSEIKTKMVSAGQADVSEANLQEVGIIPPGESMRHMIDLGQAAGLSSMAVGMFLAGWHDKYKIDPVTGGLASRGCGGYLRASYVVKRYNADKEEYEPDCTLTQVPYEGIRIEGNHATLKDCWNEWIEADPMQFSLSWADLRDFVAGSLAGAA